MRILSSMLYIAFFILFTGFPCLSQIKNADNNFKNLMLPDGEKTEKLKDQLKSSLNGIRIIDENLNLDGEPDEINIYNNRIEFKIQKKITAFFFSDLLDVKIEAVDHIKADLSFNYKLFLEFGGFSFYTRNYGRYSISGLRDVLKAIQKEITLQRDKIVLDSFIPIAEKYRNQATKTEMPEEQRKLIVQANSVNEKKMYDDAIGLYEKAVQINQTSYPPAYYNLALLYAQIKNYNKAIVNMSKYILLEPDAPDARSSQDKIYEWELLIKD